MNKDNERSNRRYAVIRGRKARPVTTARARVEILDSIKDVMKDDEESDDSCSSEADDEGGGDEEDNGAEESSPKDSRVIDPSKESNIDQGPGKQSLPAAHTLNCDSSTDQPVIVLDPPKESKLAGPPTPEVHILNSAPISPAMPPVLYTPAMSPPELDLAGGPGERNSLFKALAGFWPQPNHVGRHGDNDDPMSDPEHIFRDSSMVVRTDEPTSIIALALK